MHCCRLSRLTNAFSRKRENFKKAEVVPARLGPYKKKQPKLAEVSYKELIRVKVVVRNGSILRTAKYLN